MGRRRPSGTRRGTLEDVTSAADESGTTAEVTQRELLSYVATFSSDFAVYAQKVDLPRLALLLELVHREATAGKR
jgi:hypothetical protein